MIQPKSMQVGSKTRTFYEDKWIIVERTLTGYVVRIVKR